jgi:hypothetical protein
MKEEKKNYFHFNMNFSGRPSGGSIKKQMMIMRSPNKKEFRKGEKIVFRFFF